MLPLIISSISFDEKKAFYTDLYHKFCKVMAHTAKKVTNGGISTDDIIQDSLVRLLKQYEKLKDMPDPPLVCYIAQVVKNVAIDKLIQKS